MIVKASLHLPTAVDSHDKTDRPQYHNVLTKDHRRLLSEIWMYRNTHSLDGSHWNMGTRTFTGLY